MGKQALQWDMIKAKAGPDSLLNWNALNLLAGSPSNSTKGFSGGGGSAPVQSKHISLDILDPLHSDGSQDDVPAGIPLNAPYKAQTPFTAPPGEKRLYYVVARRPLDLFLGDDAPVYHEQFVADDGTNIGRFTDKDGGISFDQEGKWGTYRYTEGTKQYKAEFIEEALRQFFAELDNKASGTRHLTYKEGRMPYDESGYNFLFRNCLMFTGDITRRAEQLAKEKGASLYYGE